MANKIDVPDVNGLVYDKELLELIVENTNDMIARGEDPYPKHRVPTHTPLSYGWALTGLIAGHVQYGNASIFSGQNNRIFGALAQAARPAMFLYTYPVARRQVNAQKLAYKLYRQANP